MFALCAAAAAAQREPVPSDGVYVVREGDTLGSIAVRFGLNWRNVWKQNPEIADPDRIAPGTKIFVAAEVDARRATIEQVFRQVEQMPFPRPWTSAAVGGVLKERDGIRTFEKSSSELRFDNDTRMIVGEESVVFLRESPDVDANVSRRSIEIRAGQADFDVKSAASGPQPDVEFQLGDTKGLARAGADGKASARAKKSADGGSRVMVFEGEGDLAAAGRTFTMSRGMGAAVTADGRTSGPEKLLPPPVPVAPEPLQAFNYANPLVQWEPLAGAAQYTVEVCRDPACGQLVDRAVGLRTTRWTPRALPLGELYWRVMAVSTSGLDGYASTPVKFVVKTYWRRPSGAQG